ncbi:phosphate acyltransferase PlsX [Paraconexibacter antarcticus]|uniref:Phosphate acyltransferase n=1 Tax=Paraconexibacter antarcticus TaxID=2949664 RepID=A0ABY5DMA0_9ACTN|nr:phosphate acyltransferase PlsX [Paraconexibacter antarcticus]UTI63098.1 phosphate acyltransferase PlsX [Paraconexibacter antarcticus]
MADLTIAVDANGADLGPAEVAAGAALAAAQGVRVLLFGPAAEIGEVPEGVTVVDAPVSIAKAADPARAARSTPDASIVLAAKAVAAGEADALVSGGSTGAALAAGLFNIKRGRGIHRPALAIPVPIPGHPVTLLDVGANAEARPEHLVQFAFMGAVLATAVLGVERPRVGLLSNGTEATRGTQTVLDAHAQLTERMAGATALEFVGNIEGTDITNGSVDVVVTDGFTGNVSLKLMEGVSKVLLGAVRDAAMSSGRAKAGGLLLKPALGGLRDELDPEAHGGAYLLGLRRLGVVPHGRFSRRGFSQAILLAARGARGDLVGSTHAALEAAGALKRSPAGETPARPEAPAAPTGEASSVSSS